MADVALDDVSKMTVSQLKGALRERGLGLMGLKADLSARLLKVSWRRFGRGEVKTGLAASML